MDTTVVSSTILWPGVAEGEAEEVEEEEDDEEDEEDGEEKLRLVLVSTRELVLGSFYFHHFLALTLLRRSARAL